MDEQRAANSSALQAKVDELGRELARVRGARGGREIARASRQALYLVAARGPISDEGFCTAFAVSRRALATNAHCVALAESLAKKGERIVAVRNGDGRARLAVTGMRRHPDWVAGGARITPDVGLFEVDGDLPSLAPLADRAALQQLAPGDAIFTYGFPGRLADASAPEATFVDGIVGRLTRLDGEAGAPDERVLLQHSAYTTGGTSGSPIFDDGGRVVAVNAGGYVDERAQPLQGYNFGMRIDLVQNLLMDDAARRLP